MRIFTIFLLFFSVALSNAVGNAQITVHYQSLEARIAKAESVFRGSISKVSPKVILAPGELLTDGTSFSDGMVEYTIAVKVDEVLKGKVGEHVELVRNTFAFDKRFDQWLEAETSFLWFVGLESNQEQESLSWDIVRLGDSVPAEATFTMPHAPPIFSMDLTVLKQSDEILDSARRFVKDRTTTERLEIHWITIPHVVANRCSPSGDANFFSLPVVAQLEETSRRMIESPDDFIPADHQLDSLSRYQLRLGGVDTLRYFKSDENIARLTISFGY
jgi:hypothetical protein